MLQEALTLIGTSMFSISFCSFQTLASSTFYYLLIMCLDISVQNIDLVALGALQM